MQPIGLAVLMVDLRLEGNARIVRQCFGLTFVLAVFDQRFDNQPHGAQRNPFAGQTLQYRRKARDRHDALQFLHQFGLIVLQPTEDRLALLNPQELRPAEHHRRLHALDDQARRIEALQLRVIEQWVVRWQPEPILFVTLGQSRYAMLRLNRQGTALYGNALDHRRLDHWHFMDAEAHFIIGQRVIDLDLKRRQCQADIGNQGISNLADAVNKIGHLRRAAQGRGKLQQIRPGRIKPAQVLFAIFFRPHGFDGFGFWLRFTSAPPVEVITQGAGHHR